MKINKKKVGYGLFVFGTLVFILWAMLYQSGTVGGPVKVAPGEAKAPVVSGEWTELRPTPVPVIYRAVGTVRSREMVEVFSRLPAARITQITVRSGDAVKKGDVLVRLEDSEWQAAVSSAEESLKGAESRLRLAESDIKRLEKIVEAGGISRRDFDTAQNAVTVTKADASMMRHSLETAKINLAYTDIRAPFDGIISGRLHDPGDLATPQQPILKLFNPERLLVRVPVREGLVSTVKAGTILDVNLESLKRSIRAEVREVIPSVDAGSRTVSVDACLIGDLKGVIPGMFARCELAIGTDDALLVPRESVKEIGQLDYLTVKTPTGAVDQLVTTTPYSDKQVRIISGVQTGDSYRNGAK
jgi:RND family efflux transporter MFP subunit